MINLPLGNPCLEETIRQVGVPADLDLADFLALVDLEDLLALVDLHLEARADLLASVVPADLLASVDLVVEGLACQDLTWAIDVRMKSGSKSMPPRKNGR